jgi:poly-gamma-glutamate synthesis protein (capsule biosynthesis protein)
MVRVRGVRIAFLSYTAVTNGQAVPHPWSVNWASPAPILRDARRARRHGARIVIVNIHWGTEFVSAVNPQQRALARRLTRSPAIDAIVGQHVHVVQPIRWMHGKPVVFGEGNLVSNQTAGCCPAASQDGLIALLDFVVRPGHRARARRVRYVPTWVRHPDYTVMRATPGSPSWNRTVAAAGRRRGIGAARSR